MQVRAKFYVSKVSEFGDSNGKRSEIQGLNKEKSTDIHHVYESTGVPHREITLSAVYDDGLAKENKSFAKATPSGTLTFRLDNAELADEFKPGDVYYLDFVKVDKA